MNLEQLKRDAMMSEAISSAELAGAHMNDKELKHCTTCNQMTNHRGDTCLKHMNDTEIEAIVEEFMEFARPFWELPKIINNSEFQTVMEADRREKVALYEKDKLEKLLRTTLTTLTTKHEEEKVELVDALEWVIPMAKGYAFEHNVGRNKEIVIHAVDVAGKYGVDLSKTDVTE
jgi:CRISPR/Cas system CMR-associated protein Cmr1 (group 7 of RAMP superfamily)